jgi:hypothetical protein
MAPAVVRAVYNVIVMCMIRLIRSTDSKASQKKKKNVLQITAAV